MTSDINLQIEDSLEAKFALAFELGAEPELLPPVYIISHKRAGRIRTLKAIPALELVSTVVVREQELEEYIAADGDFHPNYLSIPWDYAGLTGGVGRARQFCLDTAASLGQDHILILDDDMISLTVLYAIAGGKASHAFKRHIDPEDTEFFRFGSLALFAQVAEEAYRAVPTAMIASAQCNAASRTQRSSGLRWQLNRGGPPAQIQSWRVDRFIDSVGSIDLDRFNLHGDDIGVATQIVHSGGDTVKIPSILGHYQDYETQSVIRTPETAPALRAAEHKALLEGPLAAYVMTRRDLVGRPQWHSLDWKALESDGIARYAEAKWTDPVK